MENKALYFSLEQSTLVPSKNIHIGDIATIFCTDSEISNKVEKILITVMSESESNQLVITAMRIIELISKHFTELNIVSIGCNETIVYYNNVKPTSELKGKIKTALMMLVAFFGTSYSIMSYNGDVGAIDLLNNLYTLFTGSSESGSTGQILGICAYSVGLCIGMIIFFNHGINNNHANDPTPLQVQMRLYEQDVNNCIIADSSRSNKTLDAS